MQSSLMRVCVAVALSVFLSSCSILQPLKSETITNTVIEHAAFPTLAMQVQECVADYPDVRSQIVTPFNQLVDLWQSASKLNPDATLLDELVSAPSEVMKGKVSWLSIKRTIVGAGIDCGPAVNDQVARVEQSFEEIETAILIKKRVVYVLQWADLLTSVVLNQRGEVVKMDR